MCDFIAVPVGSESRFELVNLESQSQIRMHIIRIRNTEPIRRQPTLGGLKGYSGEKWMSRKKTPPS